RAACCQPGRGNSPGSGRAASTKPLAGVEYISLMTIRSRTRAASDDLACCVVQLELLLGRVTLRIHLRRNPGVGRHDALAEGAAGLPAQHLAKPAIVAIAAPHALRLGNVVPFADGLARGFGDNVYQL